MTKTPTPTEMSKGQVTTQTTPQKSSIKQRLRTDLGCLHVKSNANYVFMSIVGYLLMIPVSYLHVQMLI